MIVCLGASAGGLRALEGFFHAMPADSGCGFVVVQHLSPDFKSLMDDLLSRQTRMPIVQTEDGMRLEPNRVHLIPPKKLITIRDGRFVLTNRENDRSGIMPIDLFLLSLAQEAGARAICAILSGTGSDGAEGSRAVHAAGGLVIVQDPETAEFDGMPRSAIATGVADYTLPPERMPEAIGAYLREPAARLVFRRPSENKEAERRDETEFDPIFRQLRGAFGLDFAHYKIATVERRIRRRMTLLGIGSVADYTARLSQQASELDALYHDLLIGVTEFFRDPQTFEALTEQVYRPLLTGANRDEVRIWIAGCATGEEAYSHAILLDELARETGFGGHVSIFATDVHRSSIDFAAQGVYSRTQLGGLSEARVQHYFRADKGDQFRVLPELRQRIIFAPHNVLSDPPFTKLDLVSCRNLLIYLTPEAQERAISLFHFALVRQGVLALGLSEGLGRLENDFEAIDAKNKLFRKTSDSRLPMELRQSSQGPISRKAGLLAVPAAAPGAVQRALAQAYDAILSEHVPAGFIVNEEADAFHFIGDSARYLLGQTGRASNNLLQRTEGDLRLALATLIPKAVRSRAIARAHGVRVRAADGTEELIAVTVKPLPEDRSGLLLLHVLLSAVPTGAEPASPGPVAAEPAAPFASSEAQLKRISDLELELQNTRENLQATVEELQTTNEELQASNEEMLAANEELQSTNEELHSVNEELYTVNAEFERKNNELKLLNADLDNLFNATGDAALFLDRNLRIRKFNKNIQKFFHLLPQDIGRPIAHIAYELDDQAAVLSELERVLNSGDVVENEVRTREGHWLLKRIHPFFAAHRAIEGVVLTFTDIDHLKQMQDKLDLAMASSRLVWWEWDIQVDNLTTHTSGWCILGYAVDCIRPNSSTWFTLTHPDDLPRVRSSLDDCLQGKTSTWECEHRFKERNGGWRWVLNKGRVIKRDSTGRPLRMLGTTQDVHERHTAQSEVLRLHHAIEQTAVSVVITDASGIIEYVNPFFTCVTGYAAAEVLGQNPRVLKSEFTPTEIYRQLWATIKGGETWRGELTNRRKDGGLLLERVSIAPVKDDNGQITHFIAVKEDITAIRAEEQRRDQLEQQLARAQKMDTLGTLAGGIAHDFNNLLTSILGYTEISLLSLPAELSADHPSRSGLKCIQNAGNRAADLVRRILAFSRNHAVSRQSIRLDRLVEESLPIMRASLPTTIHLVWEDRSDGASVLGDATQLQQVLINLCTNSAHAIGDEKGRITITLENRDIDSPLPVEGGVLAPGPHVVLSVSDTGSGIASDTVDHIFEPFFTTKEAGRGTGLGLPIVLTTVLNHNGGIGVQTVPGQGCCFSVYLPRELYPVPSTEPPEEAPKLSGGRGQVVAIVDDDESIAHLNQTVLEESGYVGVTFGEAATCLEKIVADPGSVSLVVTDQTMPGMTGLDLIRELRSRGIKLPVIITSGYTRLLDPIELERLENCRFLPKPFELEDFLKAVVESLKGGERSGA